MIILRKLILALIKMSLLVFVISFEKVLGLPMIFLSLSLVFFIYEKSYFKYVFLILSAMFLGLVYELMFALSFILAILLFFTVLYGKRFMSNDINRALLSINVITILVGILSQVSLSGVVIFYYILSSVIMLFVFMKTLFSKDSFSEKLSGEKSNFFR